MANILILNSSVLGDGSVSRGLVVEAVGRLLKAYPGATVVERDLGAAPMPHLITANVAGVRGVPATEPELAARALSDKLIAELRAADTIVIGAPMYNFSISTGLRLVRLRPARWRDVQVLRGRPAGSADRQAGHRHRGTRRSLFRRSRPGDRFPGTLFADAAGLHRPDRRHLRPRREDRLRPRSARSGGDSRQAGAGRRGLTSSHAREATHDHFERRVGNGRRARDPSPRSRSRRRL